VNKTRVLIVDDVSDMRNLLASSLRNLDIRDIMEAKNAADAIEIYQNKEIDIVFLDLHMPKIDGFKALQEIRKINPIAFIVIVSGEHSIDNVKKAIKLGANGFIIKPFKLGKLQEMIEKYAAERLAN